MDGTGYMMDEWDDRGEQSPTVSREDYEAACEDRDHLETALRDLMLACEAVYKAGRIPAEPFVAALNALCEVGR